MTDTDNPTVPDEPKCAVCLKRAATKVAVRMQGNVTFLVCDECFVPPTVPSEVSDTRLLPCPFCGGDATLDQADTFERHSIECLNVKCVGPMTSWATKDAAIAAWNRRVPSVESIDVEKWADAIAMRIWVAPLADSWTVKLIADELRRLIGGGK